MAMLQSLGFSGNPSTLLQDLHISFFQVVLTAYRYNVYAYIYIYAYIQNSMTVVDTNFVALAAVFTISWLEAGWCFGFCRSSVFVFIFWENNQPSENPSPNHPPFPAEERTSIVWCTSSNVWIISPPPLSSPGAKIWVKSCGFFSVGGSCLCRKVLFQGGWEIKLTSDDFLWNDVFLFFL